MPAQSSTDFLTHTLRLGEKMTEWIFEEKRTIKVRLEVRAEVGEAERPDSVL
jgi:hypothetical protein